MIGEPGTGDPLRSPWAAVHPAEIASREFPRARKGFDPDAVRSWLRTVASAVETLQAECTHVRAERDRLEAALRRASREPASSALRTALTEAKLRRRPGGYNRGEVEALLEAAAAEIARLETRAAVFEAEAASLRRDGQHTSELTNMVRRLESEVATLHSRIPEPSPAWKTQGHGA